jgi:hypothetical protein
MPFIYNRLMLWVSQFGIAGGEAQEDTPWVGVYPDPARGPESSDLYLIVEPATPGSAEFSAELKDAIGAVFHSSKASLTGGLLRALQGAHENLREWNRRSMRDGRVGAGMSCLAVRGDDAYLAQVAPASAVFYRAGELRPVQPSLPDAVEPLGLYEEFWPEFTHFEMVAGDRLLLLTPPLARALPPEEPDASLALAPDDVLPALYRSARSLPDCGAVLVAAVSDDDGSQPRLITGPPELIADS